MPVGNEGPCCIMLAASKSTMEAASTIAASRRRPRGKLMPSLSTADHRSSPPRVDIPRDYNAAHDLVERNLAADRAHKIAYIDDDGEYTYGELAERVDRCANALHAARAAARATRAALPSRYRRLPRCVSRCDQGGHRSGRGQHAADHRRLRLHAARQPRPRADRVGSAAAQAFAPAARPASAPCPRDRFRRGQRAAGPLFAREADRGGAGVIRAGGYDARRCLLLAVFVGLDRPAQGHRARALEPDPDRRALREAGPRHSAKTTSCSPRRSCSSPTGWATRSPFRSRSARPRC